MRIVAILTLLAFQGPQAAAGESKKVSRRPESFSTREAHAKQVYKTLLPRLDTVDKVIALGAFSGASEESLASLRADMERGGAGKKSHQIRVVKDQYFVDGEATGLHLVAAHPLRLRWKKKEWSPSSSAGVRENYRSFLGFIEAPQPGASASRGLFERILPSAYALDLGPVWKSSGGGALLGGGLVMGVLLSGGTLACPPCAALAIGAYAAAGAVVGAGVGAGYSLYKENKASGAVFGFLSSKLKVTCDSSSLVATKADGSSLVIYKGKGAKQHFFLRDAQGNDEALPSLHDDEGALLSRYAGDCRNEEDARRVEEAWAKGAEKMKALTLRDKARGFSLGAETGPGEPGEAKEGESAQ